MTNIPLTAPCSFSRTNQRLIAYCNASMKRLPESSIDRDLKAQTFSSLISDENRDPAEAKPIIADNWTTLQVRSKIESRENRRSKRVTWSHVNQMIPTNPTYDHTAGKVRTVLFCLFDVVICAPTFDVVYFMGGRERGKIGD